MQQVNNYTSGKTMTSRSLAALGLQITQH